MNTEYKEKYILGLDLGSNSIGWAVIPCDENGKCHGIEKLGVRVFEEGIENFNQSSEQTRNQARMQARSLRRILERRSMRMNQLFQLLVKHGLLPGSMQDMNWEKCSSRERADLRDKTLTSYDKERLQYWSQETGIPRKVLAKKFPYFLRARGLDHSLTVYDLGRALYSLAQRRGFLSNRKADSADDQSGVVKSDIAELQKKIHDSNCRTIGEYFYSINPEEQKLRRQWTARSMYLNEFDLLIEKQRSCFPEILSEDVISRIRHAIFYQRQLKSVKHLIGRCEHEKNAARAPWLTLEAQDFRMLQMINNTRIIEGDWEYELTREQRETLADHLSLNEKMTFAAARKLLGLSKIARFNWEEDKGKSFEGNRTAARIHSVLGHRWTGMDGEQQKKLVEELHSVVKEETLVKRLQNAWKFSPVESGGLAAITLQDGYCSLSRKALRKINPLLRSGKAYTTAVTEVYGDSLSTEVHDLLPMLASDSIPFDLRNPVVYRVLTELRKVVNELIRRYGKPWKIRLELARDLKKSRRDRDEIRKKNNQNQKIRDEAKGKLLKEMKIENPSRSDIEKILLADECNWECPYTGKPISWQSLFGQHPRFDVEHIIPFSRSLDNSFLNKTLCDVAYNREVKGNRTPYETAGYNEEVWSQILGRVSRFNSDVKRIKLERFRMDQVESIEDFSSRQLNDTRYATQLAKTYLGLLYGDQMRKKIQGGRGQITAHIRNAWNLNAILSRNEKKSRDDHRHHAIDAVCTALTDAILIKELSRAAAFNEGRLRRGFGLAEEPWPGFREQLKKSVESVITSHRVCRKVNGPLHEATVYSVHAKTQCVSIRRELGKLKKNEVDLIINPYLRSIVQKKMADLGGGDPSKLFSDVNNRPIIVRNGEEIRLRRVKISSNVKPVAIGRRNKQRFVKTGSNHHMEVFEVTYDNGKKKIDCEIVTTLEAMRRKSNGEAVVRNDHGEGRKFLFSLAGGETLLVDESIIRVRSISTDSGGRLEANAINDARLKADIKDTNDLLRPPIKSLLKKSSVKKILITPLGEVNNCND